MHSLNGSACFILLEESLTIQLLHHSGFINLFGLLSVVFQLDSYFKWWYCSRYQFGFPDSGLFKSHFMSSCVTYYSLYICLLDLVIRKLVTFCPLGTEDCSQGSKDPCDRYKPFFSFSSFFPSSDESI